MKCSKCGSENVSIQVINEGHLKNQHKSVSYWIFVGWWLEIILWLFLTLPRFLILIFGHKKQKMVNVTRKTAVCQNCGNTWQLLK